MCPVATLVPQVASCFTAGWRAHSQRIGREAPGLLGSFAGGAEFSALTPGDALSRSAAGFALLRAGNRFRVARQLHGAFARGGS